MTESRWSDAEPDGQDVSHEGREAITLPRPFAVKGRPWNRLSLGWRIVWPVLVFGIVALGAGLLIGARAEATLSPMVGQQAIGHFVSSLGLISEAMEAVVAGHVSLSETGELLRVNIQAGGDKDIMPALKPRDRAGPRPNTTR